MIYVSIYLFAVGVILFGGGLAMHVTTRRIAESADVVRLTAPLAPARRELTAPARHRSEETSTTPDTYIPLHHVLDAATIRRVLREATGEFAAIIGTSYGTAEREILTGHIGHAEPEMAA